MKKPAAAKSSPKSKQKKGKAVQKEKKYKVEKPKQKALKMTLKDVTSRA